MKFIPHFSVHCANIRVFYETTKFLEVFLIRELISRSLGVFFSKILLKSTEQLKMSYL